MDHLLSLVAQWADMGLAMDLTAIRGMLGVLLGVGALIFFHEAGHFMAAKWAGVRVEVFSLGFGHRLFGFRRGDTDYRVSMLPLGGYVRMLGQADDDPNQPTTDRDDDFRNKSPGKRFVILVAGVVMNLVLAAFLFVATFGIGIEFTVSEIGTIMPGSAASKADLREGDVILSVDGGEILGWQDLQTLIALADGEIELEVRRDGTVHTTKATPFRGKNDSYAVLGVQPARVIAVLTDASPLRAAGVQVSTPTQTDLILNISPVSSRCQPELEMSPADLDEAIQEAEGDLALTIKRTTYDEGGTRTGSELIPIEITVTRKAEYSIGLDLPDHAYIRSILRENAPVAKAGGKVGDRIVAIGDFAEVTHSNLRECVHETGVKYGEQPVPFVVERPKPDGSTERHELEVAIQLQNPELLEAALTGVTDEKQRVEIRRSLGNWLLGIEFRSDVVGKTVQLPVVEGEDPAELNPGDRIVNVWLDGGLYWSREHGNDAFPSEAWLVRSVLRSQKDTPFRIAWEPRGSDEIKYAVVSASPHPTDSYADLGVGYDTRKITIERGPISAVLLGTHQTVIQTKRIALMVRSFLTGAVSVRELGGPIQIVNVAYRVAKRDTLAQLFYLLAILSVNLAVINILPIPVLDGGHIFFLAIEKLKGRPVSSDVLIWAQWVGLFCILGLMALVFFNDIRRLINQ